jgi:hypothetical protein
MTFMIITLFEVEQVFQFTVMIIDAGCVERVLGYEKQACWSFDD